MVATGTGQILHFCLLCLCQMAGSEQNAKCGELYKCFPYRVIHCHCIRCYILPVTFSNLSLPATFFPFPHTLNPFPFLYFVPFLSQIMVTILPWYNTLSKQNQFHLFSGNSGCTSMILSARGRKPTKPVMMRSLKVEWL